MDYPNNGKRYKEAKIFKENQISIEDWYLHGHGKTVGIITDKQHVILTEETCTEKLKKNSLIHEELGAIVASVIYDEDIPTFNIPKESIFWGTITGLNPLFVIYINNNITDNQYLYLSKILDDIKEYNREKNTKTKLNISFKDNDEIVTTNINEAKNKLKSHIDYQKITHDKYIVGTTLTKEEIIKNYKERFKIRSLAELIQIIDSTKNNIKDEYYKNITKELFPNFNSIIELNDKVRKIWHHLNDDTNQAVDLSNESILISYLNNKIKKFTILVKNIFTNNKIDLHKKIEIIEKYKQLNLEDINTIYPNYNKFLSFYNKYKNKLPKSLFNNCVKYDDYYKFLFEYLNRMLEKEQEEKQNYKELLEEKIKIEKIGKNDDKYYKYKNKLNDLAFETQILENSKRYKYEIITVNNDLETNTKHLQENKKYLESLKEEEKQLKEEIDNTKTGTKIIKLNSYNKKRKNLKTIKEQIVKTKKIIQEIEQRIQTLETKKNNEIKKIDTDINKIKQEINELKKEFKSETSVSIEEYEEHYLFHNILSFELKEYKDKLKKINEIIENNNQDLAEIQNIITPKKLNK